jgi:tetratricopeptide (TPR) repeat protein
VVIKADQKYQRLHFNLGILCLRQKKYAEAEEAAIDAIKLDPKHASSQRLYALATFNQNKRECALLAWCNFLMLEPQTKRSIEGCNYVKYILNYGIKKTGEKAVTVSVSKDELESPALIMQIAALTATDKKTNLSPVDSLTLQLKSVFEVLKEPKIGNKSPFFSKYYADYFGALAASDNMPAFTHYITLSAYHDEDIAWFKANDKAIKELDNWVSLTDRKFE